MIVKRIKPLSRRTLLRSAGVTLGLPFLEAMLPQNALSAGAFPQRAFFIYCPTGHNVAALRDTGANFSASPLLKPLEEKGVWEDVMVMATSLNNLGKTSPTHPRESASYLTCFKNDLKMVTNRTSVDQVYADHVGADTVFKSLETGPDDGKRGSCGRGAPCVYNNTISWRGNTPNGPIPTAAATKEHLFKGIDPGATAGVSNSVSRGASILDYVRQEAKSLKLKLGHADKLRVESFETNIRELEEQITKTQNVSTTCSPGELVGVDNPHPDNVAQMLELSAIAFGCDLTRVGSFMFGSGGSNRPLDFIGGNTTHHGASHNDKALFQKMSVWEANMFAHFLTKLKGMPEGDGTVLDNTLAQYGGGMSDNHNNDNLTMVIAGRGGGLKRKGKVDAGGKQLAGFYADMLQHLGVPVDNYGGVGPHGLLD